TPPGPGDTTPQVIPSTGGHSHAGPGGQRPSCRTAKKITGGPFHILPTALDRPLRFVPGGPRVRRGGRLPDAIGVRGGARRRTTTLGRPWSPALAGPPRPSCRARLSRTTRMTRTTNATSTTSTTRTGHVTRLGHVRRSDD